MGGGGGVNYEIIMNNPEMADIDEKYKTKNYQAKKIKATNAFKRNVPKRLRKEWGARMNFFRSL